MSICLPCVDTLSRLLSTTKSRGFRKCEYNKLNYMISQYNWELETLKQTLIISTKSLVGHPIIQDVLWFVLILMYLTVFAYTTNLLELTSFVKKGLKKN